MLNNKNPFCVDSNLYPALRQVQSINAINDTHISDSEICD